MSDDKHEKNPPIKDVPESSAASGGAQPVTPAPGEPQATMPPIPEGHDKPIAGQSVPNPDTTGV